VRNGIYSARLVIWMMISQRLQARVTLASSVEQLVQARFDPNYNVRPLNPGLA